MKVSDHRIVLKKGGVKGGGGMLWGVWRISGKMEGREIHEEAVEFVLRTGSRERG